MENCNDAETVGTGSGQFCQGCTDFAGSRGSAVLRSSVRNRPADEGNVSRRYDRAAPKADGNAGWGREKVCGNLEQILPAASALARRHVSYGAKAEHYPVVRVALLWTLEKGLGDGWTPEVADAWATGYGTLSGYMISEAYGRSLAAE